MMSKVSVFAAAVALAQGQTCAFKPKGIWSKETCDLKAELDCKINSGGTETAEEADCKGDCKWHSDAGSCMTKVMFDHEATIHKLKRSPDDADNTACREKDQEESEENCKDKCVWGSDPDWGDSCMIPELKEAYDFVYQKTCEGKEEGDECPTWQSDGASHVSVMGATTAVLLFGTSLT